MTITGGYRYDRRVLEGLRALGRDIRHIELPTGFPHPSPDEHARAAAQLAEAAPDCPVVVDGLALGAMDTRALAGVRAPIVALIHHPLAEECGLEDQRRKSLYESERAMLAKVAHVLVTSPHTARLLTARYGVATERITIARPGSERPAGDGPKADPPLILSVGIAVRRKGHDILLEALARIADRPWQTVIVGAGHDEQCAAALTQRIEDLNLGERVHLAGSVSDNDLAQLFRRAHVFALATRYEGHGMVFDEAMVNGLPIVSCAVGAVPETVAPGAGQLVPPENPDAFAAALARLLDDDALRTKMAAASRLAGSRLPDWTDTVRRVAEVIDTVAARAQRDTSNSLMATQP